MTSRTDMARASSELRAILERALEFESAYADELSAVHPEFRDSARNLVHYLALRRSDLRDLQEILLGLGLSSLGRAERNVLGSVRAVLDALIERGTGRNVKDGDLLAFLEQQVGKVKPNEAEASRYQIFRHHRLPPSSL